MTRLRILTIVARLLWRARRWAVEVERSTTIDVHDGGPEGKWVETRYGRGFTLVLKIDGGAVRYKTPEFCALAQEAP